MNLQERKNTSFKASDRAEKVSNLIEERFDVKLNPEIKRRYRDNEKVKFEMKTDKGEVFHFKGLVKDFLVASAVISKSQNDFLLAERKIVFY